MFTGIIENLGRITKLKEENGNLHLSVHCNFTDKLKVDQSVAHNGVCLTVISLNDTEYTVTAIDETLKKNLSQSGYCQRLCKP